MMYGYGMGAGWTLMVFVIALPALLIAAGLLFVQFRRDATDRPAPDARPDAERVLAGRFARGEIDGEEYEQRLYTLRAARR
jgi:putative membrane protein